MVGMLTDVGNIRTINEDYIGYYEGSSEKLYVVADGMGGHNAGEVASKIAVETVIDFFKINQENDQESLLRQAVSSANKKIYDISKTKSEYEGMGTTITACLLSGNNLFVANVGDSRCYVIKKNGIFKVTKDHSLVQQLIDTGSISEEEAVVHPNKNIITRALGTNIDVAVDIFIVNLDEAIKVIMCTDGLTNEVNENEIYDIIIKNSNEETCKKLIELCKLKGGRDNISVIVFEGECNDDRDCTWKQI